MKKKVLSLLLTLCLVMTFVPMAAFAEDAQNISVWDGSTAAAFAGGTGTAEDPYQIANGAELAYLASSVNNGETYEAKNFVLTANIDLNGLPWTPIANSFSDALFGGSDYRVFAGNFDGKGYTISNVSIGSETTPLESDVLGLFGATEGKISNLNLDTVSIHGVAKIASGYVIGIAGGLVGSSAGSIENCHVTGLAMDMSAPSNGYVAAYWVGGLVGALDGAQLINECSVSGSITEKAGKGSIGGLIGELGKAAKITYSRSDVTVNVKADSRGGANVGGFIGKGNGKTDAETIIRNCYATGNVTGGAYTGGFAGGLWGLNIKNCYASGNVSQAAAAMASFVGTDASDPNYYGSITNCFATGSVTGSSPFQYAFAEQSSATKRSEITNCYFAEENSGIKTQYESATAKSQDEMKTEAFAADLNNGDNSNGWSFVNGQVLGGAEPADYSAVEAAMAAIPTDLTVYTDESVAALNTAVDGVVRGKALASQAKEGDSLGDEVRHVVRQSVPANIEILDGSIQSGAAGDLEYLDQKVVLLKSGVSDAGKNCVRLEALFTGVPKTRIQSATFRLGTVNAGSLTYTISLFDWNSNSYIEHNLTGAISSKGLNEINLINWSDCHIDDSANIKVEVTISAESPFELSLDQMQLLLLCEESVQNVEVRNYTVENAQIEQGTTVAGTTAKNLKDRDGASFQVESTNKKVAWSTTVPLYYEKNDVQTIQVDYTGNTSEETNVIWLSLYRFDTQNWEVVGTIPGSTEEVTRSFVLSGNGISAYISEEGDIQIRVYNSASKEFIRYTDCVSVTTVANSQSQQKVYTPTTFVEEYGSSEGQIEKLDHIDGQSMKFQSDNNRKSAVQFEFDTDIDIDTIGEVTFVVALKSKNGANTQNLSLKNVSTGKFAVVKTASSSDNYEMIRFTLDSLREIEQYIDANGKLTLRIYNSASSSVGDFTREIDFVQMSITYGRFTRFEVAQLSDVHELIGSENFKAIISEINSNIKPAFSIITGDISDHGTPAQYELYLQDKQLFDGQVYTTPGNHDVRWWNANGKRTFTNQVGPLYQSFTYGGVHFVLLDTTVNFELDGKIGKAQLQWLKSDLDSIPADMPVILFGHHPFKINNNVTARHELLSATKDSNVIAFMNGHVHYYGNVVEDGVPINYITYIKDNPNQDFVTIEFSENYYYIYKRKATDHSKELWLSGRMNNTRKLRMTITNITARDNTVDVAVQIENAPDGVKSVQARIDNYGPYTQLIKNEGGIWSGSIDTGLYTPELVAGTHFVGVEAFDNENKKWTEYKDYSTPSDNPTIKWVFETGDSIQSSATINEANVYVGSNDGNLYCIDLDTGYQKWCIQTGDFVISKPAITSEGNIVFGSGDEFVYCASANDGNVIWNTKLGGSVLSDPLTSEGRVFIGCGDGKIYCLNSASGEIVWEYQTDGLMRQRPILENGILYAFVRDTYIWYAIDASTGQLIWRGNANTDESLFVCGDVRPVIANGKLWCIDAQNTRPAYLSLDTGELAWTSTLEKVSSRGMTTNGSTVFYSSNSGRQITAFDAETNQVVWQKDLRYDNKDRDLQEMQIDSALVYNGTSLIHVAERGRITALNPDNGEILWCIDAAGYPERVFWSTPEATDGLVIATGIDGKVYAVEYTH